MTQSIVQKRLESLKITLPDAPAPVASYVPVKITGAHAFVSGQIPMRDGTLISTGSLPSEVGVEEAVACAQQCTLNALACLQDALGSLDRIESIVKVSVFVACERSFTAHPEIANGCSDLLVDIFGERGRHARAAVGVPSLPLGAPVEIEFLVEISSD